MDSIDTSALHILADAAIARAEAEMAVAVHEGAAAPREDGDADVAEAATILISMREVNIAKPTTAAFSGSTQASSGFATVAGGCENDESCWSKAARKNRDKGHKTWQTFNILRPRQDTAARISKSAPPKQQIKKPSAQQIEKTERWLKGYHEADDRYGYAHGLEPVDETALEVLGANFDGTMGMEAEVEKAGEFVEWEECEDKKNVEEEGEWRENYDDENPFLNK